MPAGKPFNITLPVPTAQVGWVIVPTVGEDGVTGWVLTVTEAGADMHVLSAVLLTSML